VACERALQYEFVKAPVDPGRETDGRILRIFERGHVMEDCMVDWLRAAGFDLRTRRANGEQFGFSAVDGRLQGHIDGVIVGGPEGFAYPALWESKCLGAKSWRELQKNRLAVAKPVYHAQVVLYQAYLQLHEHPAIFTALNADTMEIHTELVPFDAALAQRMSDRGLRVISATEAGELLPRGYHDQTHFADATTYDPQRPNNREHLAFGFGSHYCIGAPLARLEARVVLHELITALPTAQLASNQTYDYLPNTSFRGPRQLWITW
jgi:hypothetical protein